MESHKREPEWFRRWFNHTYKILYGHRHAGQARLHVDALLGTGLIAPGIDVLDTACGGGRHMEAFREAGYNVYGLDLSRILLKDATGAGLGVVNADMRHLPFRKARFGLVTSFFSSFGYFRTPEEDLGVLKSFAGIVSPGGHLFLDLVNATYLKENLIPEDFKTVDGVAVSQARKLKEDVVEKVITILSEGGPPERYVERLRLYTFTQMEKNCLLLGLEIRHAFGDEKGTPFEAASSPRMGLLLRKP